jgi:hypothetical protein
VLDEEVDRLPEKYRAPFVLCYLDGKTNDEAALELGCPRGTVQSRLAWARERLRARLTQRGLALCGGLLTVSVAPDLAAAAVPTTLVDTTLKAALLVAAGKAASGVASAPVAALTQGVLRTMLWTKVKMVLACAAMVGTLGIGGAVLARQTLQEEPTGQPAAGLQPGKAATPNQAELPGGPIKPGGQGDKPRPVDMTYDFEMASQPWAKVLERYSEISGLPYIGTQRPAGNFTFVPPKNKKYTLAEITDLLTEALLAQKYILVRRDASFTVLPADEKIDPALLPRVRLDDLAKRGKTEMVTVVVPLTTLKARDIGPDVKKLLGLFGQVTVLEKLNQLIIQDTAGNVREIYQVIQDLEARGGFEQKK